ncbi:MAG: DUF4411 family protein [Hyphomicrobiales bacterium]
MYLLDANTIMEAHGTFYPIERIPQFWEWLQLEGEHGRVKMPLEIYDEFEGKYGPHVEWINSQEVRAALLLEEEPDPSLVQQAIEQGYQGLDAAFDDIQHTKYGKDPFLVAYALVEPTERVVVTREVSKRTKRLGNTKLPDACDDCGIECINDFELYSRLDFNLVGR